MADQWKGGAAAVAQVDTASIDTYDAASTYTVTIGQITISEAGDTDVATTATNLRASLNASTHPYFAAITWSGTAGNIIGTGDTAGVPFIAALTVSGGTGTVTDFSTTTACTGPHHWDEAENWSDGAVPVDTDDLDLADSAINICWGLAQSAIDLGEFRIADTFTGRLGLSPLGFATSADGETLDTSVPEYRQTYLSINWDDASFGARSTTTTGSGSPLIRIKQNNTAANTTEVLSSGTALSGLSAYMLHFVNANSDLDVQGCSGGLEIGTEEIGTGALGDLTLTGADSSKIVFVHRRTPITNVTVWRGSCFLDRSAGGSQTTLTIHGGEVTIAGFASWTITTANAYGGSVYHNGQVTVTTLNLDGATWDCGRSSAARTITTFNPTAGTIVFGANLTLTNWSDPRDGTEITYQS